MNGDAKAKFYAADMPGPRNDQGLEHGGIGLVVKEGEVVLSKFVGVLGLVEEEVRGEVVQNLADLIVL